jgi:hypothetical protein
VVAAGWSRGEPSPACHEAQPFEPAPAPANHQCCASRRNWAIASAALSFPLASPGIMPEFCSNFGPMGADGFGALHRLALSLPPPTRGNLSANLDFSIPPSLGFAVHASARVQARWWLCILSRSHLKRTLLAIAFLNARLLGRDTPANSPQEPGAAQTQPADMSMAGYEDGPSAI